MGHTVVTDRRMAVVRALPEGHPLQIPTPVPTLLSDRERAILDAMTDDGLIIKAGERSLVEAPQLARLGPAGHRAVLVLMVRMYLQVHVEVLAGKVQREVITCTPTGLQARKYFARRAGRAVAR